MVHRKTDDHGRVHSPVHQLAIRRRAVEEVLRISPERRSLSQHRQVREFQKHVGANGAKHQCTLRFLYWE